MRAAAVLLAVVSLTNGSTASAQSPTYELAAALSLTGESYTLGKPSLEGVQLALEEFNRTGGPRIELKIYDDLSTDEGAKAAAQKIIDSKAVAILGPAISTLSLASGPMYAKAGIASMTTTATSDLITQNATTFRLLFKNSEQGEVLATYLVRVLRMKRASVIVVDNGYGRTIEQGFRRTASQLGIEARYFSFKTEAEAEAVARTVAAEAPDTPVIFAMLDSDGARILPVLVRLGAKGPFLGGDAFGDDSFPARMVDLPEERRRPGHFTERVYGISPMVLDSANADTLAFAERYRARFGHDPVWFSVAGYDAARLALAALRAIGEGGKAPIEVAAVRAAILTYLNDLRDPTRAPAGLLGPLAFDAERGRQQAVRIGRFNRGRFESAPIQIVPVTTPDAAELASGAVFELDAGRFARLQRIVYTGIYVNEIPRVELTRSTYGADFYLWMRFAADAGPGDVDPTDLIFPNLIGAAGFDRALPAEQGLMSDGTQYRLWRIQGEFRNDFDLRRFPFDRQTLKLQFFNGRAAADRIIYALDKRSTGGDLLGHGTTEGHAVPGAENNLAAAPTAFRNLTQWEVISASQRRENLVTDSGLGDPRRVGAESFRELSGFVVSVDLQRLAVSTVAKTLLPLVLMTLILYGSLYFPAGLVKEKVTVAVTAALTGSVLLSSINNQLGNIGYSIAIEYVFYVFFGLCLFAILSILVGERIRVSGDLARVARIETLGRIVFLVSFAVVAIAGIAVGMSR